MACKGTYTEKLYNSNTEREHPCTVDFGCGYIGCVVNGTPLDQALGVIREEVAKAMAKYPPFNSAHEGYAVLLEEVDELWEHVKVKQGNRDVTAMYHEAKQVAAMAIRFMIDLGNEASGQK